MFICQCYEINSNPTKIWYLFYVQGTGNAGGKELSKNAILGGLKLSINQETSALGVVANVDYTANCFKWLVWYGVFRLDWADVDFLLKQHDPTYTVGLWSSNRNKIHRYLERSNIIKVIICASEHICSIVRYCFRSFKQL